MKNISKILLGSILLAFSSCQLTEIDELQPKYKISAEDAFSSPANAEIALVGVYNKSLLSFGTWWNILGNNGGMGIELTSAFSPNQYHKNEVTSANVIASQYSDPYIAINTINYFIQGVGKIEASKFNGNRKQEMLGEAHFLRAQQYFNLLRSFGKFWDINSEYGVVIHTEPNVTLNVKPRSSVKETYDLILADLDFAIANAPKFKKATYASKEAAEAFKAQVLLYKGDYVNAIKSCDIVINSGTFKLEPVFADIFSKTFNSSEAILVNYWDTTLNNQGNWKDFYLAIFINVNPLYDAFMPQNDPRRPVTLLPGSTPTRPKKVGKYQAKSEASFYMRLAELYLIKAESIVRSGGSLASAQAALDVVRSRVGLASTNAPNAKTLLEDIRVEKALELAFEDAQPWFDLVRYAVKGDINITSIKPTITSEYQYILPIPEVSRKLSNGIVIQNPGY